MGGRLLSVSAVALAVSIPGLFPHIRPLQAAQYRGDRHLSIGDILVASEKMSDPNFAESVILIVQYGSDSGTEGIVVNRRTDIPIDRIFPKAKRANKDSVYIGGPVEITAVQAILRLPEGTDHATHVVADVYVTGAKELIEESIGSQADASKFRLYLGYAGWAPGQLEAEIQMGAWSVLNGNARIVFDKDPDSLWSRLARESHMQIAAARVQNSRIL